MPGAVNHIASPSRVLAIVLGGGQGARLFPLTRDRAEPAVPLGGKYRLVDIPISNCINSGMDRIYLLTQFNSASLHRHIAEAYQFDQFSRGFVEILAAGQTFLDASWYQGTADAVRKNQMHFQNHDFDYALILSSDQLYRMDYRTLLAQHIATDADVTIAAIPMPRERSQTFGLMEIDAERRVTRFMEKPANPVDLEALQLSRSWCDALGLKASDNYCLASMGIYLFSRAALWHLLENDLTDLACHILPSAVPARRVFAYLFQGYWEDIGTLRSFFEANLKLTDDRPSFDFFDRQSPIFSHPDFLPASKINGATIDHAIIADGCIITQSRITRSLLGIRSLLGAGSQLNRVVMLGSDSYEFAEGGRKPAPSGVPPIGVGPNCRIENTIIDKNARIGANCTITPDGKPSHVDAPHFSIRDGIVIVPRYGVIPDGTVV